jgi:hypothetical protein
MMLNNINYGGRVSKEYDFSRMYEYVSKFFLISAKNRIMRFRAFDSSLMNLQSTGFRFDITQTKIKNLGFDFKKYPGASTIVAKYKISFLG